MVLGGLISAMEIDPVSSDVSVGINPLGPQWADLYKRIFRFKNVSSTDIEGYDINNPFFLIDPFIDYLRRRFRVNEEHLHFMRCMMISSICPYVFIGTAVYWMFLMGSGAFITSWWNSTLNSIVHRSIYKLEVYPKTGIKFRDACEATYHGDDNSLGISDEVKHLWNGKKISEYRKKWLNWTTTSPDKGTEISEFDEVTKYLKREFLEMDGYIFPALDKNSIESMMLWYRDSEMPAANQQFQNFETAVSEAFYHGREYFEKIKSLANKYSADLGGGRYISVGYDELMSEWCNQF